MNKTEPLSAERGADSLERLVIPLSEDSKSRIVGDNPTPAVREKMRWLDDRDNLDRLSINLRR